MYRCIVVGTDGSPTAAAAVGHAVALAKVTGAALHLVTAWSSGAMGAAAGAMVGAVLPDSSAAAWAEELLRGCAQEAEAEGLTVQTHAVEGPPVQAIIDVARATGADLIVTGNRGMTGLRGVLGSVPNSLAHRAPCAVLIVPTT